MRGTVAAAAAALAGLAGCSLNGGDDRPEPVEDAPRQVVRTVHELDRAVREGDWRKICDELFSRTARRRAGGRDCRRLLRSTAGDLRRPRLELREIEVGEDRATVRVSTRAAGQPPLGDTIVLVREGGEYRIDSLAR